MFLPNLFSRDAPQHFRIFIRFLAHAFSFSEAQLKWSPRPGGSKNIEPRKFGGSQSINICADDVVDDALLDGEDLAVAEDGGGDHDEAHLCLVELILSSCVTLGKI